MIDRHYDRRGNSGYHDPRRDTPPRRVSFEDRPRDRSRSPPRKIARQNSDRSFYSNSTSTSTSTSTSNNNNNSPRRAHTLSAANARCRSPELFVQSPPPIQPDRSSSPNGPEKQQTTRCSIDVKNFCAHIAETVYYSLQQDTAEKKYKKVYGQAERYRETNFNSAMEVIDQQMNFADQERNKAAKQHIAAERRLQEVFVKYHKNLQSDLSQSLAASATAGSAIKIDDIDSRFERFRESLTVSIEKKVAQKAEQERQLLSKEFESHMSSMKAEVDKAIARTDAVEKQLEERLIAEKALQVHISSLQNDLENEKTHRVSLERKLKEEVSHHQQEMDKRLKELEKDTIQARNVASGEMDKKLARLAKRLDSADCSIKNAEANHQKQRSLQDQKSKSQTNKVGELSTRLLTTETRVNELDKDLSVLKQETSKSPKTPPHTPTPNDSLHSGLQNTLAEVEKIREQLTSLQNGSLEHQPPADNDLRAAMFDQRIAQARKEFQTTFSGLTAKFGELINKEKAAREQLDTRVQEIKKTVDHIISLLESRLQDMDSKYTTMLAAQDGKVAVLSELSNKTRTDAKAAFEDFTMQLGNLTSWQNNWNTSELYLQIVNHINASYPQGVFNELSKVTRRLEAVEVRVERSHDKTQSPIGRQQTLASMTPVSSN